MRIVQIQEAFIPATACLYGRVFGEPPWEEVWTEDATIAAVRNPLLRWWVAVEGGKILGFVAGCVSSPEVLTVAFSLPHAALIGSQVGYLAELGVAPEYRRAGLARNLTAVLLEYFRAEGIDGFAVRTRLGTGNYPWYLGKLDVLHEYADGRTLFGSAEVPDL